MEEKRALSKRQLAQTTRMKRTCVVAIWDALVGKDDLSGV